MSEEVIAIFEFKEDPSGALRFGGTKVLSRTLESRDSFVSRYDDSKASDIRVWLLDISGNVHNLLDGKIWIGHGIIGSDVPRLKKAFAEIGKDPPKPKAIYDTRVLLLYGDDKLAKLALHFGLGKEGHDSYENILQNINTIKQCEGVMSLMEPDKLKKFADGDFHPMVSYSVSARFNELDRSKIMSDKEIAFFELKKDGFGSMRFGAMQLVSQTLTCIGECCSILRHSDDLKDSAIRDWLLRISYHVHCFLDGKIWIGHGIKGSDVPNLMKAFEYIGKDPPKPKAIYDTRVLLSKDKKLAEMAGQYGLGKEGHYSHEDCPQNIAAIKQCERIVSINEPEKLKKYADCGFNPMISYLMDLSKDADVTASFSQLDIEKEKEVATLMDSVSMFGRQLILGELPISSPKPATAPPRVELDAFLEILPPAKEEGAS